MPVKFSLDLWRPDGPVWAGQHRPVGMGPVSYGASVSGDADIRAVNDDSGETVALNREATAVESNSKMVQPTTRGEAGVLTRATLFLFLAVTTGLADLVSKSLVFARLYDSGSDWQEPRWMVEDVFGFQTSLNAGALFGMGQGQSWFFALVSMIFLAGIMVWLFAGGGWRDRWMVVATGLIAGGILGNLYDRLGFGALAGFPAGHENSVRDWILFQVKGIRWLEPWPNFNLADSFLVIGAGLILIHGFFMSGKESPPVAGDPEKTDS